MTTMNSVQQQQNLFQQQQKESQHYKNGFHTKLFSELANKQPPVREYNAKNRCN